MTIRPRRSVLYMPAANARAMEKAQGLDADGFIFDLEDAVAPDAKVVARAQLASALARFDYRGRERVVRVNGLGTPWAADDLRMAAVSGADAVLVHRLTRLLHGGGGGQGDGGAADDVLTQRRAARRTGAGARGETSTP